MTFVVANCLRRRTFHEPGKEPSTTSTACAVPGSGSSATGKFDVTTKNE